MFPCFTSALKIQPPPQIPIAGQNKHSFIFNGYLFTHSCIVLELKMSKGFSKSLKTFPKVGLLHPKHLYTPTS